MKHLHMLLIAAVLALTTLQTEAASNSGNTITEQLQEKIASLTDHELIRINITLKDRFDSQKFIRDVSQLDKKTRRARTINALKDFSRLSQQGVLAELNMLQRSAEVTSVKAYWIANVINCLATPEAIKGLAQRSDIASIDYDEFRMLLDPDEWKDSHFSEGLPGSREITWNVLKINADEVWALGFNGEGILVSVIDTGVNYDHHDLQDHVWENADYPYHGYDFINNDNNPMDDHGHGTHCAGTVAGDGTAGSQTGVAPEATIMCCKVMTSEGSGTESAVWSAVEFSVEQGADVMSLSLGWQHSWGANRSVWRQTFDNSLAAGIIASVAAGNEGEDQGTYPIPDNVRTPGDCPPPWLHPDQTLTGGISGVICVGSTTSGDNVSGFSSRGPLDWSEISPYNDYPYQPEMGLIRPDISAPGSNIKSLAYYSNTGYEDGWSGTSMATPANAGMIALMLQKNPELTPEQISQTIEETAHVLTPGKNNNSGSGRIDALAAVQATTLPGPVYYAHQINDASGNGDGFINPGETPLLTLSLANFSDETVDNVNVTLSCDSEFITITDSTEYFGNFGLEDIIEIEDAFAFEVANNIPGGETVKFNITTFNDDNSWESSFTETAHGVLLQVISFSVLDINGNNNGILDPGETATIIIEVGNNGQIETGETMAYLSSTSSLVNIISGSFDLETLEAGESKEAQFDIEINAATPVGATIDLALSVESGYYQLEQVFYPKIGLVLEDFESGDFNQFDWEFGGNEDWAITSTAVYEGSYCAKSGEIGNEQYSELKISINVPNNDTVAFYRKVSSEADYDYLRFYIDNQKQGEWEGEEPWARVAFPVDEGSHVLSWRYEKDTYVAGGQDCAWIDYIELPTTEDVSMSVFAGTDNHVCENDVFQTNAMANNYNSLLWESSGTGTFDDNTILESIYTPGVEDLENGSVTLSLTVYDLNSNSLSDDMVLSFDWLPIILSQISGPQQACQSSISYYAIDEVMYLDSYEWELTPMNAGAIVGDDSTIAVNWGPYFTGQAILKVRGVNECGQGSYSEPLNILVEECTGLEEFQSNQQWTIQPNPASEFITLNIENDAAEAEVLILDLTGKARIETRISSSNASIDVSSLKDGLYFISIQSQNMTSIQKLIIRK